MGVVAMMAAAVVAVVALWVTVAGVESRSRDAVCATVTVRGDVVEWARCLTRCVESAPAWTGTGSELLTECEAQLINDERRNR